MRRYLIVANQTLGSGELRAAVRERLGDAPCRFHVVVPAIVVLGIVRGTALGPIKTVDDLFGTAYGVTWLTALVVTVAVYLWGLTVLVPALRRMDAARIEPDGSATPELTAATDRVKRLVGLELIGFLAIFTCMILMRFGL